MSKILRKYGKMKRSSKEELELLDKSVCYTYACMYVNGHTLHIFVEFLFYRN